MFCPSSILFFFIGQQLSVFVHDWGVDLVFVFPQICFVILYTVLISCLEAAVSALFASSCKCFLLSPLADFLTSLFNSLYCVRNLSLNFSNMVWPITVFSRFLSCMRSHMDQYKALIHSLCCRVLVPSFSLLVL